MQNNRVWVQSLLQQLNGVLVGKPQQVRQSLCCLLAGGHLLIEDVPGVGKTTLAQALALSLGLDFALAKLRHRAFYTAGLYRNKAHAILYCNFSYIVSRYAGIFR